VIKVWDYLKEYEAEREDILAGIEKVLRSGTLIMGPSGREFEAAFSAYCGVRHGVGVDNATNGLALALRALGVEPGDEVVTVPNTAVPTVSAIVAVGAVPRFVDVDPETYLMDPSRISAVLSSRTRCLLPVHLFGQCVDMAAIRRIAQQHRLRVLEDCAQSHGATQGSSVAGSMSDASVFSFYPTKVLGGYGDGGMVLTDDESVAARLRRLRFYGMEKTYYAEEQGYNSRLDEVHAEILLRKLRRLDTYISRRRELAARYDAILGPTSLSLPRTVAGNGHVYYLYVVRHPERDRILEDLVKREILLNVSYRWPIHTMRGYSGLGYQEGQFPNAEAAQRAIFSLPMYPSLTNEEQDTVCRALGEVLGERVGL
jgi:dTDP-3-amino-2,3,6-trideoxy-4-keto-D-glucose/dTDP-3-amino-3,4,6-trideoxy-alpha-D-glucose/dTDP-2,6-dideoxy-D-kanosamine transaminase